MTQLKLTPPAELRLTVYGLFELIWRFEKMSGKRPKVIRITRYQLNSLCMDPKVLLYPVELHPNGEQSFEGIPVEVYEAPD